MNGHDCLDAVVMRQAIILGAQQGRDHACLPVVRMDNIRPEVQQGQAVEHRPGEEGITLILISAHAIDIVSAKIVTIVHEIKCDSLLYQRFNPAVLAAPAKLNLKIYSMVHL